MGSRDNPVENDDGSVTVNIGPEFPDGVSETKFERDTDAKAVDSRTVLAKMSAIVAVADPIRPTLSLRTCQKFFSRRLIAVHHL